LREIVNYALVQVQEAKVDESGYRRKIPVKHQDNWDKGP